MVAHSVYKVTCVGTHESTKPPVQKVGIVRLKTELKTHLPAETARPITNTKTITHLFTRYLSSFNLASSSSSARCHCSSILTIPLPLDPVVGYLSPFGLQPLLIIAPHSRILEYLSLFNPSLPLTWLFCPQYCTFRVPVSCTPPMTCILFIGHLQMPPNTTRRW